MLLVISIVGIIALLVIVVTVTQYEGKKEQKQLRSLLAARGHTNIVLIKTSMTLGDGDPTYHVEYTALTASGIRTPANCHRMMFFGKTLSDKLKPSKWISRDSDFFIKRSGSNESA